MAPLLRLSFDHHDATKRTWMEKKRNTKRKNRACTPSLTSLGASVVLRRVPINRGTLVIYRAFRWTFLIEGWDGGHRFAESSIGWTLVRPKIIGPKRALSVSSNFRIIILAWRRMHGSLFLRIAVWPSVYIRESSYVRPFIVGNRHMLDSLFSRIVICLSLYFFADRLVFKSLLFRIDIPAIVAL